MIAKTPKIARHFSFSEREPTENICNPLSSKDYIPQNIYDIFLLMQEVTEPSVVKIVRLTKTGSEFLFSLGQQSKRQNHADSCPD